ncbi:uncharacterized protein BJ171DRAFT_123030 [Polychytrium aggregatum]|uniref:uncharacterized protein n=1 Tax=Polychytrium aggregatum TaxID=110093 RepID=UPI0022FE88EA|nr:uncharacterized protein BJ171DRAFT_123030 [Polychytrium aggregatum]KAI9204319.1 hypothetical protein BJ171DRAFT_123030 [Polychytrium aggregatum]
MRDFVQIGRKIIAIGRNYAEHAKELGNAVPKSPMFFLKPTSSYLVRPSDGSLGIIERPKNVILHHEIELALVIGKNGRDIKASRAMDYVSGYALALDMTARNLQDAAKSKGHPWSVAKGFDTFTPIGEFIEKERVHDPSNLDIWLKNDGKLVQNGNTRDMLFSIPALIEYVSSVMRLEAGDVILTGTPAGVGPVLPGQILQGGLRNPGSDQDIATIEFQVADRPGSGLFGCEE